MSERIDDSTWTVMRDGGYATQLHGRDLDLIESVERMARDWYAEKVELRVTYTSGAWTSVTFARSADAPSCLT